MKSFLLVLCACITLPLYASASGGISGRVVLERGVSFFGRQSQIDDRAKTRLQHLLDHEEDGLRAKLQKVISSQDTLAQVANASLQEEQDRFRLKRAAFEQTLMLTRQDLAQKAILVLKDFNVDAAGGVYERYLTHEYADAIDEKAQEVFQSLRELESRALHAALEREKGKLKDESRPFRFGTSLFTNVVKDVQEDVPKVAPLAGVCAVAVQYVPIKTREKVEEGVGTVITKYPVSAAGSLALLFTAWQAIKYGTRYFAYAHKASVLDRQVQEGLSSVCAIKIKQPFVDQVPHILQCARESATIARLEHEVQQLAVSSSKSQQLLEAQCLSLQSLQTFARAHGVSLQDALRRLDEVCAWHKNLQRDIAGHGEQLQQIGKDVNTILRFLSSEDSSSLQAAREHRSASVIDVPDEAGRSSDSGVGMPVVKMRTGSQGGFLIDMMFPEQSARRLGYAASAFSAPPGKDRAQSSSGAPVVPQEFVKLQ